MVFQDVASDVHVWIKESSFSVQELMSSRAYNDTLFAKSSMSLARLAPQDYHR